jgi:hypothetical protein
VGVILLHKKFIIFRVMYIYLYNENLIRYPVYAHSRIYRFLKGLYHLISFFLVSRKSSFVERNYPKIWKMINSEEIVV